MNYLKTTLVLMSLILLILFYQNLNKSKILNTLYMDQSKIKNAGRGIFTTKPIKKGTFLFTTIINDRITPPGAMINHCNKSNTDHINVGNKWYLYSNRYINSNEELLVDYNIAPSYISPPEKHWEC